nr:MAG TPA: type I restriction enzyme [Caudoviricetes sp.]
MYYLNIQENRYLAELRDKLLNDLMTGKIEM